LDVSFVFGSRIALPRQAPVEPELSLFSYGANDADIDHQILLRDFQALPSKEATNQNSGGAVEPLSLVHCECPANDHFCRMARKAVSLRCSSWLLDAGRDHGEGLHLEPAGNIEAGIAALNRIAERSNDVFTFLVL
jgi:hypothetical protein